MTSARSRNIWEFIIFTYFVLFSWLQKYNFSKMNAFGLSLISLFFSCLEVQRSQIHILWNNNLPITFPINIPKALTITKPHYFPNTFTIPSTPINQIFIYHPFLNKYPKTFTILYPYCIAYSFFYPKSTSQPESLFYLRNMLYLKYTFYLIIFYNPFFL